MTKPELKTKIRELKALRLEALEFKEKEKALRFRHQISQLKKKSRRITTAETVESAETHS
jgi:protein-arginine kinase activator protein McsA